MRFGGRFPHEIGHFPITYFQTLVEMLNETSDETTRNDGDDENGNVVSVDVDSLIRKGQTQGFAR